MGLNIKPAVRVAANGTDVTTLIMQRFVSLRLSDEAGLQSDTVEIVLADDPNSRIDVPVTGAELNVWLGYDALSSYMGLFVVDEVVISGPPDRVTIRAKASPQDATPAGKTTLQSQKTRSWPKDTTLSAMAETIAADHGLSAAVASDLASIALPHIDQVNESDINLITRVAKDYDALAKPAAGKLILAKRGASKSTSGTTLTSVSLIPSQVTSWRITQSKRVPAGTVIATWRNLALAMDVEESVGEGEPVTRLRHNYADQAAASKAARADYDKRRRAEWQLSLALPGNPSLVAEVPLQLSGFRSGVNGAWLITRSEHSIDASGYKCILEADQP